MEEKKGIMLKNAMTYGLYIGLALIVVHLMQYLMDVYQPPFWVNIINYLIMIVGIVLGTIRVREQELNGFISYGKALGHGVLIGLCASIILGFYFGLLTGVIDTSYIEAMNQMTANKLIESGMDYDQVEMAMGITAKLQTPLIMTFSQVIGNTFFFFIFSLITSIFIKKEEPLFGTNE